MAVGTADDGHSEPFSELEDVGTFAESWNGSAWSVIPSAGSAGPNPTLYAISCTSPVFCVAAGLTHSDGRFGVDNDMAFGAQRALIEVWNGATWTVEPNPGAAMAGSGLFGVSCRSTSFCVAVGQHSESALVEAWNGTSWRVQSTPTVAKHGTWPAAVSCLSPNACTLVGSYNANTGPGQAAPVQLAERWNGRRWSVQRVPGHVSGYPELRSISCVSQSFCLAGGTLQMGNGTVAYSPLAERWNGGRWTGAMSGFPKASALYGVSCISAVYCLAVGQFDPRVFPPSNATDTFAEGWNGTHWARIALPPVAVPPEFDQTDPALLGISCLSQIGCTAVGDQAVGANSAPLTQGEAGAPSGSPESPAPVPGRDADVQPVSGSVLVKLPGSSTFVALSAVGQIPFGTVVDATHGSVSVTTPGPHGGTQTVTLSEGEFVLTQDHNGVVVATLTGGDFSVCPTARERAHIARAASKHATAKHVVRKLFANGHGDFTTAGNTAAASVRGTKWLTEDLCEGTLIHVVTDQVAVTNLVNHRHVKIKAGHSYLAKLP